MTRRFQDHELEDGADMGWVDVFKGLGKAVAFVALAWLFGSALIPLVFGR
ncbi:hypothetical protein P3G55_21920 [Leptospira sp. 96542]|nr:hypothetical protein [Leptospira sp. 96542]